VDRGGDRSSSTRGHSRRGGEERRGAASAVWIGRDGGTFYRGGEAVVGMGDGRPSSSQRCTIEAPVTRRGYDGAAMIHGEIQEESVAHRFSSIWVRKGIHRRRAEWWRQPWAVAWPLAGGGRRPRWAGVGPSALGPKADGAGFSGRQKKWRRAARGNGPKSKNKEKGAV
jgi:hypothetical protein